MLKSLDFWKFAPTFCALAMGINAFIQFDDYSNKEKSAEAQQVLRLGEEAIAETQEVLDAYRHALSSGNGALQVNSRLSTDAWDVFFEAQSLNTLLPGLQGIGYVESVKTRDLYRYVSLIRRYEINDFRVYPRSKNDTKFVVKLSHELNQLLNVKPGFDMSSIPALKRAMVWSTITGKMSMSEAFTVDESPELVVFLLPLSSGKSIQGELSAGSWLFAFAEKDTVFSAIQNLKSAGLQYTLATDREDRADHDVMGSSYRVMASHGGGKRMFGVDQATFHLSWKASAEGVIYDVAKPPLTGLIASAIIGVLLTIVVSLFSRIYGRTSRELGDTQQRFALAVQAVRDGLIDWGDMKSDAQYWSSVVWETLGVEEPENATGGSYRRLLDAVHPEDRGSLEKQLREAQKDIGLVNVAFRIRTVDQDYRWQRFRAKAMQEKDRVRLIGRLTDEHERMLMEELQESLVEQLTRSNEELERFAFVASHDLQEPLRQVRSFSELATMELAGMPDNERVVSFLKIVEDSSQHMQNLIVDLLDYARPANDDDALELINGDEVLDYALSNLQERLQRTEAVIEREAMPNVQAHSMRLSRVMQNIISNSLKYIEEGTVPLIKIGCNSDESFHHITIEDNGIGMEAQHLDKIFEPFKRLHTRSEYAGTGMGLSICKRIIESYGGQICVRSEEGVGSVFTISLPCYVVEGEAQESGGLNPAQHSQSDFVAATGTA